MDLSCNSSNDSESDILNERNLPVELQTPNIVHSFYHTIVPTNPIANGRNIEAQNDHSHSGEPYVTISEQPQQRGFRFRYECEGPSHGGLQGMKSERGKKSYPTIKIENYTGAARVVVTLVTDEKNPRCHAHKLVGTNCKNGKGTMEIQASTGPISFPNLCILHVTRKKLVDVLTERIVDTIKLSKKLKANNINIEPEISDEDRESARNQAKEQSKNMQLNVVRLCFQVFLRNPDGSFGKMLTPVVSQPIYDSKSPGASALKICRMDKYGGCCSGNEEVFLLCEKVQKDDIQVRFVEQSPDGKIKWESYGNFGPIDVHRQYAIVFKTPPYWNTNIEKAVNVFIMLQRRSDQEVSEPIAFTYFPQNRDKDNIASKKRKRIPLDGYDFGGDGGGFGADFGGDGNGGGDNDMDGDGKGGGDMRGGNHQTNQFIIMQSGDITQQRNLLPASVQETHHLNLLPTSVEEAIKEYRHPHVLPSEPCQRTPPDYWFACSPPMEIQVDADPQSSSFPPDFPSRRVKPPSSPRLDSDDGFDQSESKKDKSVILTSDYFDSGVETQSNKSFVCVEEKKDKKEVLHSETLSTSSSLSGSKSQTKSGTDEMKTSKPLSLSGTQSDHDVKDHTTIKSDEGFSESSEEAATRRKLNILKKGQSKAQTLSHSSVDVATARHTDVSDTFKRVAECITERTVLALKDYAETGDVLHLLLVQRHLMALSNSNGDLPLHLGIINSQMGAVKNLVKIMGTLSQPKTYINALNFMRQTPLHLATILDQQPVVELLLHAGADPTIEERNGNTPAHLAVMNKAENCLMSLVKYVRPGTNKLNPFPELNYLNYEGFSPVHLAAMSGSVPMLRRLVFGKADLDLPDGKSGKTPLHHTVDNDDLSVARYLLMENNCDVNARCFDGNTALHIACARQLVGMVALLVSSGADIDIENEEIPDPLIIGEDQLKRDRRGHTPIDYADGNEKILSILYKDYDDLESSYFSKEFSSCLGLQPPKAAGSSINYSAHSSPASMLRLGKENENSSFHRDMRSLILKSRVELSRMLDSSQKDVFALAEKLNYPSLSGAMTEISSKGNSPTTFLLEYFESQKGSVKRLEESLIAIGRQDAASLLQPTTPK